MIFSRMRLIDIGFVVTVALVLLTAEYRSRVDLAAAPAPLQTTSPQPGAALITCPLRKPDFATVMQAAFLGDGTLVVEQQTSTRVRHIKDC